MYCLKNKLIAKIVIWLAAEILLNFLGMDDLADYSEFTEAKYSLSTSRLSISISA